MSQLNFDSILYVQNLPTGAFIYQLQILDNSISLSSNNCDLYTKYQQHLIRFDRKTFFFKKYYQQLDNKSKTVYFYTKIVLRIS